MSSRENSLANRESLMELVGPALARGRYDAGRSIRRRPSTYVSQPPDQIWGEYNNYRKNGVVVSAIIHGGCARLGPEWSTFRSSNCPEG
jgi:hypothetical protein